jgi:hypothetical protein
MTTFFPAPPVFCLAALRVSRRNGTPDTFTTRTMTTLRATRAAIRR